MQGIDIIMIILLLIFLKWFDTKYPPEKNIDDYIEEEVAKIKDEKMYKERSK